MLRGYVILLCAGSFVSGIAVDTDGRNAAAKSQGRISGADKQQDLLALPSQVAYQNIVASRTNLHNSPLSYQVNSAVVDTISEDTPKRSVPVHGSPNVQQQTVAVSSSIASNPSSPEHTNILERYAPSVQPVQSYFAAPVPVRTFLIGSQQAANVGQDTQATDGYITRPYVVYNNNGAQTGQYNAAPPVQAVIEQQRTVNILSPSSPGIQYHAAAVPLSTNSASRPFYPASTALFEAHEKFIAQSPSYQVNQVNQVEPVKHLRPQLLPAAKIAYNVKPEVKTIPVPVPVAKKVTIEAHNSVQTHPPPAPKYAPVSIPVPVIYQQLETNYLDEQQLVVPTPASYPQAPIGVHPIPVPVYSTYGDGLQYHSLPVAGRHQQGYARVVQYSPASEVSRVTFNGLGVSYGW